MTIYQKIQSELLSKEYTWLVTGVAGFIGSHLLEKLLTLNQKVVGLDNFSTGHRRNLIGVEANVGPTRWKHFQFVEGDIVNSATCQQVTKDIDFVLHQAALGSVPRSLKDPINTNASNVTGFINMLNASRQSGVNRFVYAASSSTYGDHPALPKVEEAIGNPLSPYAVTKYVNELYAAVFARCYNFKSVGLRYFNVFGPRQDPGGAYAAVIPKWIGALTAKEQVFINGDGETSRDFCYVANAVQANILAAIQPTKEVCSVYNVAVGDRTTLNELFQKISDRVSKKDGLEALLPPEYRDFRDGDVKHSQANISKIKNNIGYDPKYPIDTGLDLTVDWFLDSMH